MLDRADLYDPELVALLSRGTLPGTPSPYPQRGAHISQKRGASLEFSEHTEYTPGDDLKHLDWKVFAKTDRPYVRRYEDERLQRVFILVDSSGSMSYGGADTPAGSKYHLAAKVAVALAATLIRQGESVGLGLTGGEGAVYMPPRPGNSQLEAFMDVLGSTTPAGEALLGGTLGNVAERLGRGTALVIVSDFLDEEDEGLDQIGLLRARGIKPRLVHVLHPDEIELPFDRTVRFVALESPAELMLDPDAVRRAYIEEMREFITGLSNAASTMAVPYALVRDTAEAGRRLISLMRAGNGRAGGGRATSGGAGGGG